MQLHDFLAAIGIVVGLVGIVLVVTPGLVIEVGAIFFWALFEATTLGWIVAFGSLAIAFATTILKYQRPGRRLKEKGIPRTNLLIAVIAGIVGLFVIPVLGAPIGFVIAIYIQAWLRVGRAQAWQSTKDSLRALVHSVGIELAGGGLIVLVWAVAVLTT